MVETGVLGLMALRSAAVSGLVLAAGAGPASAAQYAQSIQFEGNALAALGIVAVLFLIAWLTIRIAHRVDAHDRRSGRPDLRNGGFLGDVDNDDNDGLHVL